MKKTAESKRALVDRAFNSLRVLSQSKQPRTNVAIGAVALTTVAISVLAAGLIFPSASRAGNDDEFTTFTVDVAQDGNSNRQVDVDPSEGQLLFSNGDVFIVDGTIYPGGTLPRGKTNNDPNAPGGIGKYRLRGTLTANSADFDRAVAGDPNAPAILAIATEVFSLPDDGTTILTDGVWPNAHFSAYRAVLGGTKVFAGAVGEIYEENIGENSTGFCNSRVTFKIRRAQARRDR